MRGTESSLCCSKGKVVLEPLQSDPVIQQLLESNDARSKNYKQHIRQYNASLSMVSASAKITNFTSRGPYCFNIHGQFHHNLGSFQPQSGQEAKYGQLYFYDTEFAAKQRMNQRPNEGCDSQLMSLLSAHYIASNNPYAPYIV